MKLLHGFEDPECYRDGFVAIGNFDGVHRGHQSMIATLIGHARSHSAPAVVLTFDPHPIELLRPGQAPPNLTTLRTKAELMRELGVDCVIAYPTDSAFLNLTPDAFFHRIVQDELRARGMVEGPNFFFGKDRAGNVETLKSLCGAAGLLLEVVSPVQVGDQIVSSSAIRAQITQGQVAEAAEMLGRPYRVFGHVVSGSVRGGTLGFPTANLAGVETLLPHDGVYAGIAHCHAGAFAAAINLGSNPTFGESERKLEVHLLDYSDRLYGQELGVDFLDRLRDIARFESREALQQQVQQDVDAARALAQPWLGR